MEYIVINGQNPLNGNVNISGAKNAAVAILPASIASGGVCEIDNLPQIEDVMSMISAMQSMGIICDFKDEHTLVVDARNITSHVLDEKLAKNMRASYYFMGALLGRYKQAEVPLPGGCDLGSRPIDYHLKGFAALGATCIQEHGVVKLYAEKLKGANIYLDCPSVGATINIMMAAVFAEGITLIENAAKEPHIVDTANFLNKLGAKIGGAGTATIRITGVPSLGGGEYTVLPDPIEAGTYMIAAAITGGDVTVENIIPKHMDSVTSKLKEMGCLVTEGDDWITVRGAKDLRSCEVKTAFYPGFPTDLQPQMATLLCKAQGTSTITENVFEQRFRYIGEIKRLGAQIKVEGRMAVTKGSCVFTGAEVSATDLRAGAALVIAGLCARGETVIGNVGHLDRGYERFEEKFRSLGADIKRIKRDD
ncbi:MAG: UDP-N-acetylglucosamine 1-carboxyvinyltransferase [Clostridiales bacterium]|jgi:UDP-N-acetylglucosamine 1-carboxyvinyltransferase|nr:UDP-N-acetylglucosamine 1-carboxyvinyltransferase [Clostridiales bacterium]